MTPEDEQAKIEEVYGVIKREGPITRDELVEMELETEEHIRRITRGLENASQIRYSKGGWVDDR